MISHKFTTSSLFLSSRSSCPYSGLYFNDLDGRHGAERASFDAEF